MNRDVHQKWIEGGNYELCIDDVRDEIWDMVKPADPLRITLADLLNCKQGGTVASMLIDVRGFWAHDNRENLLQEEEEPEEEQWYSSQSPAYGHKMWTGVSSDAFMFLSNLVIGLSVIEILNRMKFIRYLKNNSCT